MNNPLHILRPITKMMRVDPEDRDDIQFLVRKADLTERGLHSSLERAIVPPVPEIEEAFAKNRAWLLALSGA